MTRPIFPSPKLAPKEIKAFNEQMRAARVAAMKYIDHTRAVPIGNAIYREAGYICCYCGKIIPKNISADLHEILIYRGVVREAPLALRLAIMVPENCGPIHRSCHDNATGTIARMRGISYLLCYEGYGKMITFLRYLSTLGMNYATLEGIAQEISYIHYNRLQEIYP